ncbi:MAG: Fic family protein [Chlamydiota bacterium]
MGKPEFKHYKLELVQPRFDSPLTDLIIDLDYLRKKPLKGTTHAKVFFQLKEIFHLLESLWSARIEGNNTTLAEYIETKIEGSKDTSFGIKEIQNIESAMEFAEQTVKDYPLDRAFVSEMHKKIVQGLPFSSKGEGDPTPGEYRAINVTIQKSNHIPPEFFRVTEYMGELFEFINKEDSSKYDLLKIAIAHHRFVWVHPFKNGNGRTVRMLTYAMLIKSGFNVNIGRILNPTAVFCSSRDDYYKFLDMADKEGRSGLLSWCEYVLRGLRDEIEKIDRLLDYKYLKTEILEPALHDALQKQYVTGIEFEILKKTVELQVIKAGDLKDILDGKSKVGISRQIKKLIDKKMLISEEDGSRKYVLSFNNNYLLRSVMYLLDKKGFLPIRDKV